MVLVAIDMSSREAWTVMVCEIMKKTAFLKPLCLAAHKYIVRSSNTWVSTIAPTFLLSFIRIVYTYHGSFALMALDKVWWNVRQTNRIVTFFSVKDSTYYTAAVIHWSPHPFRGELQVARETWESISRNFWWAKNHNHKCIPVVSLKRKKLRKNR